MEQNNDEKKESGGQNRPPEDETKIKFACAAAYFWILFFVPLIVCPDDARGRFHANQGLALLVVMAVLNAAVSLIGIILPGFVKTILFVAIELAGVALTIIGILNVCADKTEPLPVIGKIKLIK